jgi:hypothetical protein
MKFTFVIFCMVACAASAQAQNGITNTQNGITNTRDSSGNLVRNTGMNPVRGPNQVPGNNPNGAITSTLGPTAPVNSRLNRATGKQ